MSHISFTYWWWIDWNKAYSWNIRHDWVIEWNDNLQDEESAFNEIIDKAFWPTKKDKLKIMQEIYNNWLNDSKAWLYFEAYIENKLNKN